MTHTLATLELSQAAYDEIAWKLKKAGYDHVFLEDGLIDMQGIGVLPIGRFASKAKGGPRELNGLKYVAVPVNEITTPQRGTTVYTDMWWAVTDDGCVLFYTGRHPRQRSPQCNVDRRIVEHILPGMATVFLPVAFVPPREGA
ncbi:hypothetical protein RE432_14930 [Pusillimonas sp. SM2304]|uniref:hypothetical protein n=1 Tax=Pusillimonas sp. SM2304 TaxID=3073241 RepID=UPI0028768461|nr:hypothetical protein [Pusillimonas sp. SM2304]MDS1141733.1 hypothetical protein [Pusillimonas sp. SM2304]